MLYFPQVNRVFFLQLINFRVLLTPLALFICLSLAQSVSAATFTVTKTADTNSVTCSAECSLREAVTAANNTAGDDIVNFSLPLGSTILLGSPINITSNISINGPGLVSYPLTKEFTISGNNATRIFNIPSAVTVTIGGLTLSNGSAAGGGAIYKSAVGSSLTLNYVQVINSTAGGNDGGGVLNIQGSLTVLNSTFSGNSGRYGGGIYHEGDTLKVQNSTFDNNTATGSDDYGGGGIFTEEPTVISNSTFFKNSSAYGGGGIYFSPTNGITSLTIRNSTFSDNTALFGGGIFKDGGNTFTMYNTIVAGNTATALASSANIYGTINTGSNNFVGGNPMLGPLADNGGPTKTLALQPGSTAINAGANSQALDINGQPLTTDQRGIGSARITNGAVDIGAFEFGSTPNAIYLVTRNDDRNLVCNPGIDCSLREAVKLANNTTGDQTINFLPSLSGQTITLGSQIDITSNMIIQGFGQFDLTVSGNNITRIFNIPSAATVTIGGLTLANGAAGGGGAISKTAVGSSLMLDTVRVMNNIALGASDGGGVFNFQGSLTILNSTFSGNTARTGGGIYHEGTTLKVQNSTFNNNTANGTGDFGGGGIFTDDPTTISNSTFSGNTAAYGGGGLYNLLGNVTIRNSTFTLNTAKYGGGIMNSDGAISLGNTILSQNSITAGGIGPNIYNGNQQINLGGNLLNHANAMLAPLAYNGGPTQTHGLLAGSPALNAGVNAQALDINGQPLTTDQRGSGFTRFIGTVDVGAFEGIVPNPNPSDLTITKTHTGNFTRGQSGSYTITVSNIGTGSTTGTISAVDTLPAGLTATGISGTGWNCTLATLTCTRSDVLASASSYPVITLNVSIASNAPASVTNTATVSGGGEENIGNNTATDQTNIDAADLTITKTHSGNFTQGQTGAQYTIVVSNNGTGATSGIVSVTDTLPVGLTATNLSGTGWSCILATLTCTRNDLLSVGSSYPPIILNVNVANNAPATVTNTATVSGGGENNTSNNTANDQTNITALANLSIIKTDAPDPVVDGNNITYSISVTNNGPGDAQNVVITDSVPAGTTFNSITQNTGPAFNCSSNAGTISCTSATLANGATATFTLVVTVNAGTSSGTVISNTASITSDTTDPNISNNSSTATTAVINRPTITKSFSPSVIQPTQNSTVTLTLSNPNSIALTSASFTDNLLNMSAVGGFAGGSCSGASSNVFAAGATALSFSGITIPANSSCTVTFAVTSSTIGTHSNQTSGVTTSQTLTPGTASNNAQLIVSTNPVVIGKGFTPTRIQPGGASLVTVYLSNASNLIAATNASFTDTLINMTAVGGAVGGTCSGVAPNALQAGATSLSFSGITIPAQSQCTITYWVTSNTTGTHPNVLSGVSSDQNPTPGAVSNIANLTVTAPPSITKSFSPSSVSLGGTSTLVVTITNPSINVAALQDVGVEDIFPAGITVSDVPAITSTCSNGSVTPINEGGGVFIAAATIPVNSSCTFTINVKANLEGSLVNKTGVVTSSNGGNGNQASATLSVGQRTNVALAGNGGVASASSIFAAENAPSKANDGSRVWANGGGWKDATANFYPDWLQVNFNGSKTINEIDVYAVKDDFSNASEPTDQTTFSQYGITDYEVQYWNGSNWVTVPGGSVNGNNKVWRKFSFAPITTTAVRVLVNNAQSNYSRIVEVEAWAVNGNTTPTPTPVVTPTPNPTPNVTPTPAVTPAPSRTNVALSANGAVAQASSYLSNGAPSLANDGVRNWATSGAWKDSTPDIYPDILEINFASAKTIDEIDVFAVKDDFSNPTDPTINETFSQYGITNFEVQYWNGSNWMTVPNGYIANTNKVITRLLFSPINTNAIRVVVNNAQANYSRIVELEAWSVNGNSNATPTPTPTATPTVTPTPALMNVALSSKGSTAFASSTNSGSSPSIAIDGVRNWASTGAWKDDTPGTYPDVLEVHFNTNRTISEIDVYAVKEDYWNAVDPTTYETFATYGITNFEVQYWNGSSWMTVPNGSITNNNKVVTKLQFAPITTNRIRVVVNNAQTNYSRIVELEAWGY